MLWNGEKLKKLRDSAGLTQSELANITGGCVQTISRYETGSREPKISDLEKIADALNVSPVLLLNLLEPIEIAPVNNEPPNNEMIERKEILGKTYIDGKSLDGLAIQLRDRLYYEFDKTDSQTLENVKNALHECLRLYADNGIELKHA